MRTAGYQAIGPDRPMGDREGSEENWSPEEVEEVSKEEVRTPETGNDIDEPAPDDPTHEGTPRSRR
jgi:hypothetical protein